MDLSKVLGDVYSGGAATSDAKVPEWADDAHLDQVFAGWTPGPPADAPAAEREMAAHVEPASRRRIDDDLASALTQALTANPIAPEPLFAQQGDTEQADDELTHTHVAELVALREPTRAWSREDDDILPARGTRKPSKPSRFARH